jgi:hypothetical protein
VYFVHHTVTKVVPVCAVHISCAASRGRPPAVNICAQLEDERLNAQGRYRPDLPRLPPGVHKGSLSSCSAAPPAAPRTTQRRRLLILTGPLHRLPAITTPWACGRPILTRTQTRQPGTYDIQPGLGHAGKDRRPHLVLDFLNALAEG